MIFCLMNIVFQYELFLKKKPDAPALRRLLNNRSHPLFRWFCPRMAASDPFCDQKKRHEERSILQNINGMCRARWLMPAVAVRIQVPKRAVIRRERSLIRA
jgi:hypothetical protein